LINKPSILFVHNKYLFAGGEDSVVHNELNILKKHGYAVHYKEFNNEALRNFRLKSWLAPGRFFFNIAAFFSIYKFIKKNKITVVHVHNLFYTASPSVLWAAKFAGAKTILTLHNYRLFCLNAMFFRDGKICMECHTNKNFKRGIEEKCFKSGFFSKLLANSLTLHWKAGSWTKKIDQFVVINPLMRQLLIERNIPENKITFKPNFLPEENDQLISKIKSDYYFFAGRIEKEKGIEHLIEAFHLLGKKLVIAGEGSLSNYILAKRSPAVNYIGQQNQENIKKLLAECKALVFPSLWLEGAPMIIIEAQSKGTVTIAARSPNIETMIENEVNGFLYDAGNVQSLVNAVNNFESKTTEQVHQISQNALMKYEQNYTGEMHVAAIEKLYLTP
jgi:glycosyltransferase involved in cell wall biosynthesis